MKKKILLTGTTGFIGKIFLKEILKKNYEVIDVLRVKNRKNKELLDLKEKYKKNYKTIFFSDYKDLMELKKYKFECFINFATLYKNTHTTLEIPKFIESNITFPSIIYDLIQNKTKKMINLGTMMQHSSSINFSPKNFYASTKSAFEMIAMYYGLNKKNLKIYNLKFYESFFEIDTRKKLIPTLIKNYKNKKVTNIVSKKLELNIIHVSDIINGILLLMKKNYQSDNFHLLNKKNMNIYKFINKFNKDKINNKIKVKFLSSKIINKPNVKNFKPIPGWYTKINIEKRILNTLKNEIN